MSTRSSDFDRILRFRPGRPRRGAALLGHLHGDHTHEIPFCTSIDHPDAVVRVIGPAEDGRTVDAHLAAAMSPPNFPIAPDQLRGSWSWERAVEGHLDVEGRSPTVSATVRGTTIDL